MMNFRKLLSALTGAGLAFLFTGLPVLAVGRPLLVDQAGLLSNEEAERIEARLEQVSDNHQMDIVVVTASTLDGKTPEAYADDFFDYNGYGYGENYDGLLLLISMEDRDIHLSTSGYGITAFTDYGLDRILEETIPYFSEGQWADGFEEYANLCDQYIIAARNGTPIDVPPEEPLDPKEMAPGVFALSCGIGAVVGYSRTSREKKKLKNVRFKSEAADYLIRSSFMLNRSEDNFLHSTTRRIKKPEPPKPSSTRSGGGSTTHFSSSGRVHGGRSGKF